MQLDQDRLTKLFSVKKQQCWAPQYSPDGTVAVNVTLDKEGPYVVEKVEHAHANVETVRGYFPIKVGNTYYAVEEMSKITKTTSEGSEVIFAREPNVFGLGKSRQCDWLVTTVGRAFPNNKGGFNVRLHCVPAARDGEVFLMIAKATAKDVATG